MLVGREKEINTLQSLLISDESELVSVIGRRRVGKTFLVQSVYAERIAFEITGIQHASLKEQLEHFSIVLSLAAKSNLPLEKPKSWLEAFRMLILYLENTSGADKRVVFFDEMPWLATHRSGFLNAFGFFWNSWAVKNNIVVVICGSAASWMIQKIVNNRGGLHNRITKRIFLKPFDLKETAAYLQSRNIHFDSYQIAQIYMAIGGIPHYLKEIEAGKSAVQNINDLCFAQNGLLRDEFPRLYPALFARADNHITIVKTLAQSRQGMSRVDIVRLGKLPEGGQISKVLDELEQSGFITSYYPFGKKKKDTLYRLTDEYSLFYLRFIEKNKNEGPDTWRHLSQTQTVKIWSGYAYENLCLKHLGQIKKALGIAGVFATAATFHQRGTETEEGAQIDLVLDRNDHVINLFEIKFYNHEISLTEAEASNIRQKVAIFKAATGTRKYIMVTMITVYGLKHNKHSLGLVENVLTLEDMFG